MNYLFYLEGKKKKIHFSIAFFLLTLELEFKCTYWLDFKEGVFNCFNSELHLATKSDLINVQI